MNGSFQIYKRYTRGKDIKEMQRRTHRRIQGIARRIQRIEKRIERRIEGRIQR